MTLGKRLNILFINDPASVGGATKALIMLSQALKKYNCIITVCVSRTPEIERQLNSIGINTIETNHIPAMLSKPRRTYRKICKMVIYYFLRKFVVLPMAVKKVEKAIDLSKIDIIHTNSARSDLGCLIAQKYSIPHIVHLREFGIEDYNCMFLRKGYFSYLNNHADCFISVSDAVKNSWIKKGIDKKKITTIYDGIDINEIIPKKKYQSKCLKLVMAGGIFDTKGQHICIKALRALPSVIRKKVFLDIIGWENETYRKYLDNLIKKYDLQDNVRFLGVKDNIGKLLCDYDVGIMASKSEGFGLVTAEYMTAGLCVIASNSGANPELISNGINGMLFDRENYRELADHIKYLFIHREVLKNYALCGQKRAREIYTIDRNANEIYSFYNKIRFSGR